MSENKKYTWAELKEFCNKLTDEQLSKPVRVVREDETIGILEAAEIGADHYKFDDEEFSVSKEDFDPNYTLDGKYKTLEEAVANEGHILVPDNYPFLFEDF